MFIIPFLSRLTGKALCQALSTRVKSLGRRLEISPISTKDRFRGQEVEKAYSDRGDLVAIATMSLTRAGLPPYDDFVSSRNQISPIHKLNLT